MATTFTYNDGTTSTSNNTVIGSSSYTIPSGKSLTSVNIGSNVTSIGLRAFQSASNLTSVTFAEGSQLTTIGNSAFRNALKLTSITIPVGVISIDSEAFSGAGGLTYVVFAPGSQLTSIGFRSFFQMGSLTSITIPASVITIGESAFGGASALTSLIFEAGSQLTTIGNSAFAGQSKLTSIIIPASVTRISYQAFQNASGLTSVTFEEGSQLTSIEGSAFQNVSKLTSIIIPATVTSIGAFAFSNTRSLASFTVVSPSSNVSSIDGVLFNNNGTTLVQYPIGNTRTTYNIPATVTSIVEGAFQNATAITSVIFAEGSQLTSIGNGAFQTTTSLTSIIIPASVTSIGAAAFRDTTSLTFVTFEAGSQLISIGSTAFQSATSLTSITIPATVASIGNGAFSNMTSLTSITVDSLNSNYNSIDGVLFNNTGTTLIHYPIGNTRTTYTIPATVTRIEAGAFSDAIAITSVLFEEGSQLTSIGEYAFQSASALISITIPEGVTSIERFAFRYTSNMTSVSLYLSTITALNSGGSNIPTTGGSMPSFYGSNSVTIIVIGEQASADTIDPVITLVGSATVTLTVGQSYTDAGATASDNKDGNITANIVTSGTVNTAAEGTYTITYNVSDAAGNTATPVTRTVIVEPEQETIKILLQKGWNLIGSSVKATISGDNIDNDNIWTFGNMNYTKLTNNAINTNHSGIWINSSASTGNEITLTLDAGESIPIDPIDPIYIALQLGWNIIGTSKAGTITGSSIESIYSYNTISNRYELLTGNSLSANTGYLIKSTTNSNIITLI